MALKIHKNPHWSFVEFMCSYFEDLAVDNNYKYQLNKLWMTKGELKILEDWHIALDKCNSPKDNDYDNEAILNDPKWIEISHIGLVARNKLAKILKESERQILTEEIDYLKYI